MGRTTILRLIAGAAAALWSMEAQGQCSWSPLGTGMTGGAYTVHSVASWDPDGGGPSTPQLVAGGTFLVPGHPSSSYIARWDGTAWHPFGSGMNSHVYAVGTWDPDGDGPSPEKLVAGGGFTEAGGVAASRVAVWDPAAGGSWQPMGAGLNQDVRCLHSWDADGAGPGTPVLVAGGYFGTVVGGPNLQRVARWDGSQWQGFGNGLNDVVFSLASWDPDGAGPESTHLVAGGSFDNVGGSTLDHVAHWNGSSWQAFGSGLSANVFALSVLDLDGAGPLFDRVIAAWQFAPGLSAWEAGTSAWQPVPGGVNPGTRALTLWDADGAGPAGPDLVAAGVFSVMGSTPANFIARRDSATGVWMALGSGLGGTARCLATWDPDGAGPTPSRIVVGGDFSTAGGGQAIRIASWSCATTPVCYSNCDASTTTPVLNVADFTCFLQRFAAADPWSNCDQSSTPPVLNVADFTCFLQSFAAGCP